MSSRPTRAVLPLAWRLARSEGRRGLQGLLLAAGAAAVSALVLLIVLAANVGAERRAELSGWHHPDVASRTDATALELLGATRVRGEPVAVATFARLPGRTAPVPPGLDAFPGPGEIYLSPALRKLVGDLPAGQFADRFGGSPASYGTIGDAALDGPGDLVAFVGRAYGDRALVVSDYHEVRNPGMSPSLMLVSGFHVGHAPGAGNRLLMLTGAALLAVPIAVLAGAAGRLSAARREQRLAALRLAGGTPRQVLGMTAAESAVTGLLGGVAGAVAYAALLPLLARLPFGGGTWFTPDLWVGPLLVLAAVLAVTALTTVSAVSSLRQVMVTPLGVAQQQNPRRTHVMRIVAFLLILFVAWFVTQSGEAGAGVQLGLIVLVYGAVGMAGPWFVDRLGRVVARFSRRPATLLAARRLSDDPRGAWRTVSGLVLAGFIAGFFSVAQLNDLGGAAVTPGQVAVPVAVKTGPAMVREAERRLTGAGVTAKVATRPDSDLVWADDDTVGLIADVSGGPARVDAAITALTGLTPGIEPITSKDITAEMDTAGAGARQLSNGVLALSFLIAVASAGLTAAATVLDRRRVYGLLRLAGTPLKTLDAARTRETLIPLMALAGGTTAAGILAATRINKMLGTTVDHRTAVTLGVSVALGVAVMYGAVAFSKPLLRRVTADLARHVD